MGSKDVKEWGDDPPLLFKIAAWLYPVLYTYAIGLACGGIVQFANTFKLPIQGTFVSIAVALLPISICVLSVKSGWFRRWLIALLFVWYWSYHACTGITQGAISSSISRAFMYDSQNLRGEKHEFP